MIEIDKDQTLEEGDLSEAVRDDSQPTGNILKITKLYVLDSTS